MRDGLSVDNALLEFENLVNDGFILYGYNVEFDLKIMRGELRRSGASDLKDKVQSVSMMNQAGKICNLFSVAGKPKFPKLHEACSHFNLPWRNQLPIEQKLDLLRQLHEKLGMQE